jgi:hypothetical protein
MNPKVIDLINEFQKNTKLKKLIKKYFHKANVSFLKNSQISVMNKLTLINKMTKNNQSIDVLNYFL